MEYQVLSRQNTLNGPEFVPVNNHGCTLSWSNLSYTISQKITAGKPEPIVLLNQAVGRCCPGTITAIMGPSGSGKTTLLDILADRISSSSGKIEGNIEFNGAIISSATRRATLSYVAQEDTLLGSFTVLETLTMSAKLSLSNQISTTERNTRVQHVIDAMGLRSCEHTLVGDLFHKGLSGGQKRRLSIAIELLSDPLILLLDEPTSGLDSAVTHQLMKYLTQLAESKGITIICTIHQPSSMVFNMFNNVIILTRGNTVYSGPQANIVNHFATLGYKCPSYMDPAEYFIALANDDFEGHGDVNAIIAGFSKSSLSTSLVSSINGDRQDKYVISLDNDTNLYKNNLAPSAFRQFLVLLYRTTLYNVRNPGIYWVRLTMYSILSAMVGTMFYRNEEVTLFDITNIIFGECAFLVLMSVAVVPFFIQDRGVFERERANSSLNIISYVVANFLAALPGLFIISVVTTCLHGIPIGLNGLGWSLFTLYLALMCAEALMKVISACVDNTIVGIAIGASIFSMFMLCEGYMVPRDSIPSYWKWGYYVSLHTYAFKAQMHAHFSVIDDVESHNILIRGNMEDVDVPTNLFILLCYCIGLEMIFAVVLYKFRTGRR